MFTDLDIKKITHSFVNTVTRYKRALNLHEMHEQFSADSSRLTDFLMTMEKRDVPELRSSHIVPLYMSMCELLHAIGAEGLGDRSTVIDPNSMTFKDRHVSEIINTFEKLGVRRNAEADSPFEHAVSIIERVACIAVKAGSTMIVMPSS
jgi:hypothetical protein